MRKTPHAQCSSLQWEGGLLGKRLWHLQCVPWPRHCFWLSWVRSHWIAGEFSHGHQKWQKVALNATEDKHPMTRDVRMVSMKTLFSEILFVHRLEKPFYKTQTCFLCLTRFSSWLRPDLDNALIISHEIFPKKVLSFSRTGTFYHPPDVLRFH